MDKGKRDNDRKERAHNAKVLVDEDKAYPIPKISDISRQIMQERSRLEGSGIGETHENLYHESKVRLENKRLLELKHLEDNCSFHPEININSKIIASAINEDQSFIQRVERDCMDRRNKSSEMHGRSQMSLTEVMNPETNLPFFHPMVGRGPMQQRNPQNMPVGIHLYEQAFNKERRLYQQKLIDDERIRNQRDKGKSNHISN